MFRSFITDDNFARNHNWETILENGGMSVKRSGETGKMSAIGQVETGRPKSVASASTTSARPGGPVLMGDHSGKSAIVADFNILGRSAAWRVRLTSRTARRSCRPGLRRNVAGLPV